MHLRNVPVPASNIPSHASGANVNTFLHAMREGWREDNLIPLFSSFPAFLSTLNYINWTDERILFINSSCSGAFFRLWCEVFTEVSNCKMSALLP